MRHIGVDMTRTLEGFADLGAHHFRRKHTVLLRYFIETGELIDFEGTSLIRFDNLLIMADLHHIFEAVAQHFINNIGVSFIVFMLH